MRDSSGERPLQLLRDTTRGFTRSGVLLLDIAPGEQMRTPGTEPRFEVILHPRRKGFLRLPRVRRIAANVLQVEQRESVVEDVPEFGQGRPGQTYSLGRVGRTSAPDLSVTVGTEQWLLVDDLGGCDPHEGRFELDPASGQLRFGNGINGKMVAPRAPLRVAYDVSAGTLGNAPLGIGWSVRGAAGVFGRNSQPFFGGKDATQFNDLQAQARRNLAVRVTYVTPADLEAAASALADLHVVRAHELPAHPRDLPGTRTLLVMAAAQPGLDPKLPPENPLWRSAVRARLSPHLLAGQRLVVIGPRYVRLGIRAKLQVPAFADPGEVEEAARKLLSLKFMDSETGDPIWKLGRDVTNLMVKGWLRKIAGVQGVTELTLFRDGVPQEKDLTLGSVELPRPSVEDIAISIERLARGTLQ
jgi:predicted phage baseplate assembly protein